MLYRILVGKWKIQLPRFFYQEKEEFVKSRLPILRQNKLRVNSLRSKIAQFVFLIHQHPPAPFLKLFCSAHDLHLN